MGASRIPEHLMHLRVDRRGLPVPYINRWGPERVESLSIQFDVNVSRPALFVDDTDQAVPDFTAQNPQRQRECMTRGLCQVCARRLPWANRFLAIATLSVEQITLDGQHCAAVTEPWLCASCASFAVEKCPALIRRRRGEELHVVRVTSPSQVKLVVSTGFIDGPLEEQSKRDQPAMWVKAIVAQVELTPAGSS